MRKSYSAMTLLIGLLGGCSPYKYDQQISEFNSSLNRLETAYRGGQNTLFAENNAYNLVNWGQNRPPLELTSGCEYLNPVGPCAVRRRIGTEAEARAVRLRERDAARGAARAELEARSAALEAAQRPTVELPACQKVTGLTEEQGNAQTRARQAERIAAARAAAATLGAPRPVAIQPAQLDPFRAFARYLDGIDALTKASDRAAFNAASTRAKSAVTAMGGTVGTLAGGPGGALVGPLAGAFVGVALWTVGEALDAERYAVLRETTSAACWPVHLLAAVMHTQITNQRASRMQILVSTMGLQVTALNRAAANRYSRSEYSDTLASLQANIATFELVRRTNPDQLVADLTDAHDALALALFSRDGQVTATFDALTALGQQVQGLVAANRLYQQ